MKILVTGGAGFIGSHITESLVASGHDVTVFDNFFTGRRENLLSVINDIKIIEGDICDAEAIGAACRGMDLVSHQAAQLEIFRSTDDPLWDLQVNTIGTLNVLSAAKAAGVKKVVNASSACIYGQVEGLTSEANYPRPNWAYGVSKLAAEKYCDIYSDYHGLPVVNLRYGITYGEREWYRRVLTIMCKRAIQGQAPVIFGDGSQIRDFIYVKDLVAFHNLTLFSEKGDGMSFNVGTGIGTSIVQLAQGVIEAANLKADPIFEPTAEGQFSTLVPDKKRNTAELKVMLLDVALANKVFGWTPKTNLVDGLRNEITWARSNLDRWEKVFYSAQV
jgi:UDP-glucose 4-epimerase